MTESTPTIAPSRTDVLAGMQARLAELNRLADLRTQSAPTHWGRLDEERAVEADALRDAIASIGGLGDVESDDDDGNDDDGRFSSDAEADEEAVSGEDDGQPDWAQEWHDFDPDC
jgi:hypothetical protein